MPGKAISAHCRNEVGFAPWGTAGCRHPGRACTTRSPRPMGTSLGPPLFLQMRCKSVPVGWVGQEPSPTSSRGFSLEDAQHWLLLGQFLLQDPALCTSQRYQSFVSPAHMCSSPNGSLHFVQAAGHKDTTCTKQPKPGQFSGHFPAAGSCSSEPGVNRAPPETWRPGDAQMSSLIKAG